MSKPFLSVQLLILVLSLLQCVGNQIRKLAAEYIKICNLQEPCKRCSPNVTQMSHFCGFSWVFVAQLWKQGFGFLEQGEANKSRLL